MKNYSIVAPSFWVRGSGKKLRGKSEAQVLALYFMTGPATSMIGLFYQPVTTILHETGLSREAFDLALPLVSEIAQYDEETELVWLPEGAAWQIGKSMKSGDKRLKGVLRELDLFAGHPFARAFVAKYRTAYGLDSHPLASPLQAPSASSDAPPKGPEQGMDLDQALEPDPEPAPPAAPPPAAEPSLADRAKLWKRDPTAASLRYPNPEAWREVRGLADLLAATFGGGAEYPRSAVDPRFLVIRDRLAEDIPLGRLAAAIRGSKSVDYIREKPEHQTLVTILRDANQVDKFARFAPDLPKRAAPIARPNFRPPAERGPQALDPEVEKLLQQAQERARGAPAPTLDADAESPTQGEPGAKVGANGG